MAVEDASQSGRRRALFPRSFRRAYPVAVRGEGVYIWDSDGKRYLDFAGSAAVNFIGHGDEEVRDAIARQCAALEFVHSSQFTTTAAEAFAQTLLDFAGEHFLGGAVYFSSGGSEAVETALKLARQYHVETGQPQRFRILSQRQSYHGSTLGALALSGNPQRREMYAPMFGSALDCERVRFPYCFRCAYQCSDCALQYAGELERAIEGCNDEAAAFVFEPISGATLGAAVPPGGYLPGIAKIASRHGVLLIADEVMTGCGRTGRNFAVEHWGVAPDILALGKGIASGYAPLGAIIANKKVVDAIAGGSGAFVHGFTYSAHPVSLAAGRAVLKRIRAKDLVKAAASDEGGGENAGSVLSRALEQLLKCRTVGDVRGVGLLRGVEFVSDKGGKTPLAANQRFAWRVADAASKRGLLVYPMQGCVDGKSGDHLLIAPPAIISKSEIQWAVEQLRSAIEEAETSVWAGLHNAGQGRV